MMTYQRISFLIPIKYISSWRRPSVFLPEDLTFNSWACSLKNVDRFCFRNLRLLLAYSFYRFDTLMSSLVLSSAKNNEI